MTVVEPRGVHDHPPDVTLEQDLDDLRAALAGHPFPTRQDDLMAACLGRQAPVRLCSRLSTLSHATVYASLAEVLDDVAARA